MAAAELSFLGGCEEGAAVCNPRGFAVGGPSLEVVGVVGGLHRRGLWQCNVVEVG